MTYAQLRGYLFEIFVSKMLEENGFKKCEYNNGLNINQSPCELISQDGEIQGRGTNHQIDFVGIYENNIPFVFPIRILGECKYYKKSVSKDTIRKFIGVIKDIDENYFYNQREERIRFLNVPIIFSATSFHNEAANLAWAQGINIVSYHNIPILRSYLEEIDDCIIRFYKYRNSIIPKEKSRIIKENFQRTCDIPQFNTFLFATTDRGLLINLISEQNFPDELFSESNEQDCAIYFNENERGDNRVFYLILNEDNENRRFYFQVNEALLKKEFSDLSLNERINEKMKYFRKLTIIKKINGINRIINLNVNFDSIRGIVR